MIFYFSATGNCKYIATRIAGAISEEMVSIVDSNKKGNCSFTLKPSESLGIISPTYVWGLPTIVCEFLDKINVIFDDRPYVYFIATYGTTPGQTGFFANRYLERKGLSFNARFAVKMPDTWTPTFNLSNQEKVRRINANAETQIDIIISKIKKSECGDFMQNKVPIFAAILFHPSYESMRKTNHFIVENACIGCGLCERKCPVDAIKIVDGKPVWIKKKCTMCLDCLHRCPKFAIQYGKNTKKHGQYNHPSVKI